ncbi:Rieske 2Fe-2S domain-containing protein [Aquihabitans sp. G128]|uniref:QcrA and Rieske domain-containing protein n=1 Tax=Aquihabitans sp. G128 TaxID=2849779 RepID=UPI001C227A36|nr:Rieske 2Fe-2S domain-containing protein [Aquihabitans sp. G128]QXC60166.1 Rieske 2Fe-2S domain-containing protein [Aquihabitans sp. G128]
MIIVVIAVLVLVLLGSLLIVSTLRNREAERAGHLSRETRSRDKRSRKPAPLLEGTTGRDVERAAQLARRGGDLVPVTEPAPPVAYVPPDLEEIGVNRRQFLNRSIIGGFLLSIGGFGGALLAYLWPSASGGFGSKISVGKLTDIQAAITAGGGFAYYPEGRMWVTAYPSGALEKARKVYSAPELAGMEAGVVALYQKCVHLGCRVPSCATSKWFECGCHGSQYNQAGEKKGGPAPRGLDRFAMEVANGSLTVNTGLIIQGPPIGTNTTGQEAEGPHCVSGGHH